MESWWKELGIGLGHWGSLLGHQKMLETYRRILDNNPVSISVLNDHIPFLIVLIWLNYQFHMQTCHKLGALPSGNLWHMAVENHPWLKITIIYKWATLSYQRIRGTYRKTYGLLLYYHIKLLQFSNHETHIWRFPNMVVPQSIQDWKLLLYFSIETHVFGDLAFSRNPYTVIYSIVWRFSPLVIIYILYIYIIFSVGQFSRNTKPPYFRFLGEKKT